VALLWWWCPRARTLGYYYHIYEGGKEKNTTPRGRSPSGIYPRPVSSLEGRHDVLGEPAELFLELLGREPLRPVDHEVLQPLVPGRDGLDAVDDVRGRSAEPRLLLDPVGQGGNARGRARGPPCASLLVGVAHEPEGGEPLVALVVRGLHAPLGLLLRVGQVEPGAPDHVLAQLLLLAVLRAGIAVGLDDVVEDLLAVEGDHGLEVLAGHVVDGLAAGDGHPDLDGQVLRPRNAGEIAQGVAAVLD